MATLIEAVTEVADCEVPELEASGRSAQTSTREDGTLVFRSEFFDADSSALFSLCVECADNLVIGMRGRAGGAGGNRTLGKGFADLCLTTWRPRPC